VQDEDRKVSMQAAYFLGLLRDPKIDPAIEQRRVDWLIHDLEPAPAATLTKLWVIGPFDDQDQPGITPHALDNGTVDLTAKYDGLEWQEWGAANPAFNSVAGQPASSSYGYWQIQSAQRQNGLLRVESPNVVAVWHNGRKLERVHAPSRARGSLWIADVQPGSN